MTTSPVELVNRHANNLQRAVSSGLVNMLLLLHDIVLRYNIRVAYTKRLTLFDVASLGSAHVTLVDKVLAQRRRLFPGNPTALAFLPSIDSGERFGLCPSLYVPPPLLRSPGCFAYFVFSLSPIPA